MQVRGKLTHRAIGARTQVTSGGTGEHRCCGTLGERVLQRWEELKRLNKALEGWGDFTRQRREEGGPGRGARKA